MKTLLFVILSAVLIAGCSGLQANSSMSSFIDSGAAVAKSHVASTQPSIDIASNSTMFSYIHSNSTANLGSYLFKGKSLWASAGIYIDLSNKAAVANEAALRAASGKLSAANMATVLELEYPLARNTQYQKSGTAAIYQLVTFAKLKAKASAPAKLKARDPLDKATPTTGQASQPMAVSPQLQALINSLPAGLQNWAIQYGPALLRLGIDEADTEIALLIQGDTYTPYCAALSAMTEDEFMAEASNVLANDIAVTNANAASVAAQKEAAKALLSLGLSIVLGVIGL